MKFTLTSAYTDLNKEIEINSLDDLKNLPERLKKIMMVMMKNIFVIFGVLLIH